MSIVEGKTELINIHGLLKLSARRDGHKPQETEQVRIGRASHSFHNYVLTIPVRERKSMKRR